LDLRTAGAGQNGAEPEDEVHVELSGKAYASCAAFGPEQSRLSRALGGPAMAVLCGKNEQGNLLWSGHDGLQRHPQN